MVRILLLLAWLLDHKVRLADRKIPQFLKVKKAGEMAPEHQRYVCQFCDRTFPTKKLEEKHLWRKTFKLEEIGGDLKNLTKKGKDGKIACFCHIVIYS